MEELITLIGNLGFPIATAAYLMLTMNKTIQANTEATNSLAGLVQRLYDRMDRLEGGSHNE